MAGYDTASTVQSVYSAADRAYGTPNFWIRYFSPCQTTPLNTSTSNAASEAAAAKASGARGIGPISAPSQSRLNGSESDGTADGQAFIGAINFALGTGKYSMPSGEPVICWLDCESGTTLSANYWMGWALAILNSNNPPGSQGFVPGLYCNPCSADANCSATIGCTSLGCPASTAYAVWSNEGEPCGGSMSNPPAFNPKTCTGCGVQNGPPVELWQWAEQTACGLSANVDLNVGAGGFNYGNYVLQV